MQNRFFYEISQIYGFVQEHSDCVEFQTKKQVKAVVPGGFLERCVNRSTSSSFPISRDIWHAIFAEMENCFRLDKKKLWNVISPLVVSSIFKHAIFLSFFCLERGFLVGQLISFLLLCSRTHTKKLLCPSRKKIVAAGFY